MGKASRKKRQASIQTTKVDSAELKRAGISPAPFIVAIILVLSTLIVYWQVTGFEFLNYDDHSYVVENPYIQNGINIQSLKWAFTSIGYAGNWHPLTWISHMLDWQLFKDVAGKHHLINLVLHIINTLLLFGILTKMTGMPWRSGFVAGLFALHPLHVESVAWISERKDVLSAFFWMATLWAYALYAEKPGLLRYIPIILFYSLGILSKPMLVSLPFVLILLDYWPLKRLVKLPDLSKLLIEKIPLLVLAIISSYITYIAQSTGGMVSNSDVLTLTERFTNAIFSYAVYIIKMLVPTKLAAFYPHPRNTIPMWQIFAALSFLLAMTYAALRLARSRPYILSGWLWYGVTLVPVIGLVQVGLQARADRYTYIPLIGIFILIAWGITELAEKTIKNKSALKYSLTAAAIISLLALAISTNIQASYWQNSKKLWNRALDVTEENWQAHYSLGLVLMDEDLYVQAEKHFREAIRILPLYSASYCDLATALMHQGNLDEAISYYYKALDLKYDDATTHNNLAKALLQKEPTDIEKVIHHFREAIRIDPNQKLPQYNLGLVLGGIGRVDESIKCFEDVLKKWPDDYWTHNDLALQLAKKGRIHEAIEHLNEAIRIDPYEEAARVNLQMIKSQYKVP